MGGRRKGRPQERERRDVGKKVDESRENAMGIYPAKLWIPTFAKPVKKKKAWNSFEPSHEIE